MTAPQRRSTPIAATFAAVVSAMDSPSPGVFPQQSHGFAAYIVGGFIGLGVLIVAMILLSLKPKRVDPDSA